jgi:hypothetical protein
MPLPLRMSPEKQTPLLAGAQRGLVVISRPVWYLPGRSRGDMPQGHGMSYPRAWGAKYHIALQSGPIGGDAITSHRQKP